jgi:non-heme chloroperoxidase
VSTWQDEQSHHTQHFVSVADNVKLEVLDWGGSGQPLVLLAGLGNTAHVFDPIAPRLSRHFHVYGITRRGFGASSVPKTGYTADRLAKDVIAAINALGLQRPIIAGHSIAGEELSEIGMEFPERVAGLIYLDAAQPYAIYDPTRGAYLPDISQLTSQIKHMHDDPLNTQKMDALLEDVTTLKLSLSNEIAAIKTDEASVSGAVIDGPSDTDKASFAAFRCFISKQLGGSFPEDEVRQSFNANATGGVGNQKAPAFVYNAILEGEQRLYATNVPILAIVPVPRAPDLPIGSDPAKRRAAEEMHTQMQEAQITTLKRQQPSAEVVRIPNGYHYIFLSNESEVLAAITAFGKKLR